MTKPASPPRLILATEARRELGGISDTTLWRMERRDPTFPKPVYLSARLKGYRYDEFSAWFDAQGSAKPLRKSFVNR